MVVTSFNTITFNIMGIPPYFFCAFTGFVVAICSYIILMASKKYNLSYSMKILFLSLIGMIFSARLFGCLSGIYRAIGVKECITKNTIIYTGIVFYGGLFGFLIVFFLCLKYYKNYFDYKAIDVLAVTIPLFHSISRVGCFFAGCCYGREYDGVLSLKYGIIINGEVDISSRFPVQLVESLFELSVFLYLLFLLKQDDWKDKKILLRYLIIYSVGRFFLEFLRGDSVRGIMYGISFSQVLSVGIWIWCFLIYMRSKHIIKLGGLI